MFVPVFPERIAKLSVQIFVSPDWILTPLVGEVSPKVKGQLADCDFRPLTISASGRNS